MNLSAMDLLSVSGLVNYFGKTRNYDNIEMAPILLEKGSTKVPQAYAHPQRRPSPLFQCRPRPIGRPFRTAPRLPLRVCLSARIALGGSAQTVSPWPPLCPSLEPDPQPGRMPPGRSHCTGSGTCPTRGSTGRSTRRRCTSCGRRSTRSSGSTCSASTRTVTSGSRMLLSLPTLCSLSGPLRH